MNTERHGVCHKWHVILRRQLWQQRQLFYLRRQLPSAGREKDSVKFRVNPRQKLKSEYEEAEIYRVGGEGGSSRTYGIPYGTGDYQLHGSRTFLKVKKRGVRLANTSFILRLNRPKTKKSKQIIWPKSKKSKEIIWRKTKKSKEIMHFMNKVKK